MKHYINPTTREVFAYESDGSQDDIIPKHFVELSDADVAAIRAAEYAATKSIRDRAEAKALLAATDWYVTRMLETGVAIPQDVTDKRNAARSAL